MLNTINGIHRFDANGDLTYTKKLSFTPEYLAFSIYDSSIVAGGRKVVYGLDSIRVDQLSQIVNSAPYTRTYFTYLYKMNMDTTSRWLKIYTINIKGVSMYKIEVLSFDGSILFLQNNNSGSQGGIELINVDLSGNVQWQKYIGSNFYAFSSTIFYGADFCTNGKRTIVNCNSTFFNDRQSYTIMDSTTINYEVLGMQTTR